MERENQNLLQYECEKDGTLIDEHEVYINGTILMQRIYKLGDSFFLQISLNGKTRRFTELQFNED